MQELQVALGAYMQGWYSQLVPTTPAMNEYVARGFARSVGWVPGRMIDAAEEMLDAWRRNNNTGKTSGAMLPVVLVALAKDYVPVSGDYARQVADATWITLPTDEKGRVFQMRQIQGSRRGQMLIAAAEEASARSIAQQFSLWLNAAPNRRFYATYRFAGLDHKWPIAFETNDTPVLNVRTEQTNITLLAIDLHLIESIPLFRGPGSTEANDGKGDGTGDNPNGYPVVTSATIVETGAAGIGRDDPDGRPENPGATNVSQASVTWGVIYGGANVEVADIDNSLDVFVNETMPRDGYI